MKLLTIDKRMLRNLRQERPQVVSAPWICRRNSTRLRVLSNSVSKILQPKPKVFFFNLTATLRSLWQYDLIFSDTISGSKSDSDLNLSDPSSRCTRYRNVRLLSERHVRYPKYTQRYLLPPRTKKKNLAGRRTAGPTPRRTRHCHLAVCPRTHKELQSP